MICVMHVFNYFQRFFFILTSNRLLSRQDTLFETGVTLARLREI